LTTSRIPAQSAPTRNAISDFIRFTGIARPDEFRSVTRAHVIAWSDDLERREIGPAANKRTPEGATIRHRLAALSSLLEYLCDKNAVSHNPVKGVKRPRAESGEVKTPAPGDHQARELLATPGEKTIKDKRDGIVNLSGRGMLVVLVTRQLGSGNSFTRLSRCPDQAERGREKLPWVR
jgi:site-specific recombinase XerD